MSTDGMVIVGASLAGAKAAEAARAEGWSGSIRLVGQEDHLPYERPVLSKGVLIGREEPITARVHDGIFYTTNEIDLLLGTAATSIDLADKTVTLDGGRRLRFERLVLATGSSARTLSIPGAELPEVHTLRTLDDTLRLRDRFLPGRRVVIVGGSWIGTEVAACARQRGCEVVIAGPMHTLLERVLGSEVGQFYEQVHRSKGVGMRLATGIAAIEGAEHVAGVRFDDDSRVDADVVVLGVGVRPNISLATEAGLDTDQGVLVDASLATSHPDVFAAGDIAEAEHPVLGRLVRVEHWANALNQGLTAGANAAGSTKTYDRIPYFYSDQYESSMEYSGWPTTWDRVAFRGSPSDGAFVAFYLSGDRLVGGANVNVFDINAHVQRLIRDGGTVDVGMLTDVDVDPAEWVGGTAR